MYSLASSKLLKTWRPFTKLQGRQAATKFRWSFLPFRARGMTKSTDMIREFSKLAMPSSPQYWQRKRSRLRMFMPSSEVNGFSRRIRCTRSFIKHLHFLAIVCSRRPKNGSVLLWALSVRRCELRILEEEVQNRLRFHRIRSFAGRLERPIPCRGHGGIWQRAFLRRGLPVDAGYLSVFVDNHADTGRYLRVRAAHQTERDSGCGLMNRLRRNESNLLARVHDADGGHTFQYRIKARWSDGLERYRRD